MNITLKQTETASDPDCLWMQAGIVRKKSCALDFQCNTCRFDRALRRVCRENREKREQGVNIGGPRGSIIFWKDRLRLRPPSRRPCIHHMKGQLEFRLCHRDYHCARCEFDEYFFDRHTVYTVIKPVDLIDISGVKLPRGFYLHKGHTWAKLENDNQVRIGLDDFARRILGPADRFELPLVGKTIVQGRKDIILYRGDRRAAFASPVSGVVTAINSAMLNGGKSGKKGAYSDDWLLVVHSDTLRQDLTKLLFMDEARTYMTGEVRGLYEILEEQTGLMAADGGLLGDDIIGNSPDLDWEYLTARFFGE